MHPMLVTTEELEAMLDRDDVVVVDVRSKMAFMAIGLVGGAVVYVVNRFIFLPPTNPMMGLVPQIAFFVAHLLFGLVVGTVFAMAYDRRSVGDALSAAR